MSEVFTITNEHYCFWENFYSQSDLVNDLQIPSQFAVFSAIEFKELGINRVIEFGSGTGRDAFFFRDHGFETYASDSSLAAIDLLTKGNNSKKGLSVGFCDVGSDFSKEIINFFANEKVGVYARFFLHALTPLELKKFFLTLSKSLKPSDCLAVEYRVPADMDRQKVTCEHYRNFCHPKKIIALASRSGLSVQYEIMGLGLAKWKQDDASVCRQLFRKD